MIASRPTKLPIAFKSLREGQPEKLHEYFVSQGLETGSSYDLVSCMGDSGSWIYKLSDRHERYVIGRGHTSRNIQDLGDVLQERKRVLMKKVPTMTEIAD